MEIVAEETRQAARDGRGEQGQRRAAIDIGGRGEEDHDRDGHAAGKTVDAVRQVHSVDAADNDEGRKDHIDRRRNFKIEVPERDIEVAGQIAAALQHKQERSGHDELQQEFLDGCQTEIALELDLDEIIGKTDKPIAQGEGQHIQVRIGVVLRHALPAEADCAEDDRGNEHDAAHGRRTGLGVVTINLVDIALSSGGGLDKFWKIFDDRLELCYRALMCRHNRLKGTLSDAAPILWQYGALARLKKGEPIDKLLYGGYSTISLGYAGLYECVKYMTGKSHTDPEATPFALEVMQHMNDACDKWKRETNIAFSIYGSPIESTTYKFAKCLQKRFGIIDGITDKNYITNSYHVHVTEPIDAFSKLKFESQFQALSTGGAISYVEVPDMQDNIPAVIQVMRFIYDNIMYAELNTKSDYCQECGYTGEIQIVEDEHKKLIWKCPKCGCTDQNKLNVARRTCGYIGTQFWNQGRTQEIKERVLHL